MDWTREKQRERIRKMGVTHMLSPRQIWNLKTVGRDQTGEDGFLRASVFTWHELVVRKGYVVQGNVRGYRNVVLEDGSVVCGDVTTEGSITVGKYVQVYGSLNARQNISIGQGTVIGREEAPQLVAARRDLKISENCCIYGKVQARNKIRVFRDKKESVIQ